MATRSSDGLQALLRGVGVENAVPSFPLANIQNSLMDIYLSYLAGILVQLTGCEPQVAYESIQWPNELGDLVVVLPRLRLKHVKANELAVELKAKASVIVSFSQYLSLFTLTHDGKQFPRSSLFAHPFDDGINLRVFFSPTTLARLLSTYIIDRGLLYGKDLSNGLKDPNSADGHRNKIVLEFSSPNIGKEFDGAHLRSTIVGAYIASLHESMGWDVIRMNFLGDWGKHIGLLAIGWSRFGSEELFQADPLRHLLDVYTKIDKLFKLEQDAAKKLRAEGQDNSAIETQGIWAEKDAFFKKMEDGDPDALALWKRFRDVCIANYQDLYARLNISFDDYSGESEVTQETIAEVESILKEKEVAEISDEAWIIDFTKHGSKGLGTAITRYRNGTTSYLLRDIAAVLDRSRKYSFDKMIYVVSAKQDSHFQQLFKALELMGHVDLADRLQHVSIGKYKDSLPKSGSGNLLGDILDQCKTAIHELFKADPENAKSLQDGDSDVSDTLVATALMVQELSVRRITNFTLDIDKMATADGDTGLSLQQWFARLSSKLNGVTIDSEELEGIDFSIFEQDEYADVLRLLVQFPDIVKSSFKPLESSTILAYLFHLTDLLLAVWDEEEAEGGSSKQNMALLAFYECVRQVLENGMRIIGLVPIKS
jgi:arginyl-tRNA synthetase